MTSQTYTINGVSYTAVKYEDVPWDELDLIASYFTPTVQGDELTIQTQKPRELIKLLLADVKGKHPETVGKLNSKQIAEIIKSFIIGRNEFESRLGESFADLAKQRSAPGTNTPESAM